MARSEALTRNVEVTVALVSDDWAHGWRIRDVGGTVPYARLPASYIDSSRERPLRVTFTRRWTTVSERRPVRRHGELSPCQVLPLRPCA